MGWDVPVRAANMTSLDLETLPGKTSIAFDAAYWSKPDSTLNIHFLYL